MIKTNDDFQPRDTGLEALVNRTVDSVAIAKTNLYRQINDTLVSTNWLIGQYIVEFEQNGQTRANYGDNLLRKLSKRLTIELGRGYSLSNLHNMKRLYQCYPNFQTVSGKLSWSHWCQLLEIDDTLERQFYENESIAQGWTVRTLKRQVDSVLFNQ